MLSTLPPWTTQPAPAPAQGTPLPVHATTAFGPWAQSLQSYQQHTAAGCCTSRRGTQPADNKAASQRLQLVAQPHASQLRTSQNRPTRQQGTTRDRGAGAAPAITHVTCLRCCTPPRTGPVVTQGSRLMTRPTSRHSPGGPCPCYQPGAAHRGVTVVVAAAVKGCPARPGHWARTSDQGATRARAGATCTGHSPQSRVLVLQHRICLPPAPPHLLHRLPTVLPKA